MMHQSTESLDNEHEPHNDCIGNLEHHVHKVFALVRVPGEDFVYSASIDLFNKLDDYCDEQGMSESKPPFLIKGESGTGKSALLSNWLQRRERSLTRSRGSNSDCFIFWHAVGCSRQSMNVNVVIKRLIVELKDRFEITRPLPKEQERYSWELPRFLDLAAKRGKVIIVIDGLNRLVNNDGSEDSLAWLPLVFPPNVRVLLSVTIPPSVKMRQVGNAVKAMRVLSQFSYTKDSFAARDAVVNDTSSTEPMIIGESAGTNPATPTSKLKGIIMSKTPFASNLPPGSPNTIATTAATTAAAAVNNIEIDNSTVTSPGPISKGGSFIGEGETKSTSKKSRILAELDRRGIPYMVMSPLNKQLCRSLVESFIHKSVNAESASLATGPYIASYLNKHTQNIRHSHVLQNKRYEYTRASMTTTTSQKQTQQQQQLQEGTVASDEVPGFLLFNNQINALLNHSQGGTPLFLRLFLRCLQYAVSRGYSLWNVYEDWMRARSVPELLIRILRTLENNFTRTRTLAQTACDKTIAAGGLPALKQLYSWHPTFQKVVVEPHRAGTVGGGTSMLRSPSNDSGDPILPSKFMATTARTPTVRQLRRMSTTNTVAGQLQAFLAGEGGEQAALATLAAAATESLAGGASQTDESDKNLSSEVQQNLGDQAWFTTEKEANTKLQKGIRHTEESTAAALNTIKQQAIDEGTDLLQALVKSIQSANAVAIAASAFDGPGATRVSQIYSLNQLRARGEDVSLASHSAGEDDSCDGDEEYDSEDDVDSLVSLDERSITSDHTIHKNTIKITQELIPPSMRSSPYGSAEPSTPTAKAVVGYNSSTGEAMATTTDATALAAQKSAKSPFKALANSLTAAATTANTTTQSHTASTAHPTSAGGGGANTTTTTAGTTDPSEGLHLLPIYLRGGTDTTGFGDILGNALALLYTSRQGLRESELWKMLSLLQYRAERDTHLSLEMKALNHSIVRRTALFFLSEKGYLCDMFKSEDITRTGYITRKQMLNCIHKINNTIKREDVIKTLEFADLHTPTAPVNISSTNLVHYYQDRDLLIANKVHYNKLFVVLGKLNKQLKFAEVAPGKTGALLATTTATTGNTTTKSHQPSAASVSKNIHSTTATTKMQPSDDDYENFNLSGILQDNNSSSVLEGSSQETDTYLTADTTAAGSAPGVGGTGGGATPKLPIDIQSATNTAATAEQEGDDEESTFSLGPVIEESLLSILSALGVLHDPENKVLILPSDSEPFRQVIYNNYILKRGGGTMAYWHNIIIKHFQTEPNSLRKCEELPWHLQICRKWGALRDCLVDLEAFDIMAKTDLKTELLQYWVLLTEGPLPFPDPHGSDIHTNNHNDTTVESGRPHSGKGYSVVKTSGRKNKDDDGNESTFTHVLRDIDHAMETNISLKDARRRKYQHMAVPFDIVEELNKSMELWVTTYKPNTQRIHHMIIHVAKFLFEFSRNAHISPDFLRLGIDLDSVGMFAAALSEEIQSGETGGNKKTESHLDDDALSLQTTNLSPIKLPAAMTAGTSGALSPQMLGTLARKGSDSVPRPGTAGTAEVPTVLFGDTTKQEAPKFPTSQMLSSNLYHYLRWVWIQFPWIGLHSAPGVATTLKRIRLEEEKHRYDGDKKKHKAGHALHSASMTLGGGGGGLLSPSRPGTSGGLTGAPANLTGGIQTTEHTTSQLEESHSIGSSYGNNTDSAMLLRVWNVKKSDPTIPVFVKSANRKLAAIKPRSTLTTGLERNVEVTFDKLYDEITSPSHIAKIRLGFKNKDKYRRPFEEEVQYNKNIPFAYHGTRAMKAGSLFPSYEKTLAESHAKHQLELENEAAQSRGRHKKRPVKRFDVDEALQQQLHNDPKNSSTTTPFMLVELDDEIRRINNDEYLNKHKTENIGGAIIKDENDLEYETMKDRIARIKTIRNKLTVIHNTKVRTIQTLYSQVMHRHETDQQLIDEVVNSEVLLKHLNERNMTMETDMIEAEKIKDGYNELLKVLKNNPPYIEAHIKALEIEVQLAEKQFQELCEHRNKLYHETEMTDQYKRDQLIEKIQYFQHARYEIAVKKKQIMRKTKQLKGPNKRESNRRLTKSGKSVANRMRLDSVENTDSSNSDSENSQNEKKNLQLTAPVMHFLNALVRKTTFNEAVVKESDHSLEDIKKRFEEDEQLQQQGGVSYSTKNRRLNRMGSMESMNGDLIAQYAAEAVGNVNNAAVTGTVGSATSKIDQNDGENSIGGGSLNSRNAGGSNSSSVAGSQTSRDSNNMHKAVSIGFGPDVYIQEGRRSSGFGSGPGMLATGTFSPPYYLSGGHGPTLSHPSSPQQGAIRRKLPADQMTQLREAVRNFLPPPTESELRHHHHHHHHSSTHTSKDPFRAQVHRAFDLLLEKTSSSSADELIERFLQGQSLLSSLRKQQTLVDSRVTQLQSEHAELFAVFNDLAFISDDPTAGSTAAVAAAAGTSSNNTTAQENSSDETAIDNLGSSDRYLDNQLFAREVRLNQIQRKSDHAELIVSDVRAAIGNLINLMNINAKLLYALPKTEAPAITCTEEILTGMSWFEDRIMALSEALAMDANKPTGANTADDNKPLFERQLDLAMLVQKMNLGAATTPSSRGNSRGQKKRGGISSNLINAEGEDAPFTSAHNAIMVPPVGRIDKIFDNKMARVIAEREKHAEAQEQQQRYSKDDENNSTIIQNFLNEGLNLKETKDLARSANLLVNKRSGRTGSYGLVLENLLVSKGQHFHPTNSAIHAKAKEHSTGSTSLASPSAVHSSVLNNSVLSSGSNIKDNTHTATGGHSPYTSTTAAVGAGSNTHPNTAATTTTTDRHSRCSSPVS